MWEKVLKLEEKLPKQLIVRSRRQNTELAFAIALTKLGEFEKAEIYAKRAIQNIERELKINKSIEIHENICPSKDPKDIARFRLKMQSLCLAYHHFACIKQNIGNNVKAAELFEIARLISVKFVKDQKILKIINQDTEKIKKKSKNEGKTIGMKFSNRKSMSDLLKVSSFKNKPDEKQLLSEIFGKNKEKIRKKLLKNASFSVAPQSFQDSLPSISNNLHEYSFKGSETSENQKFTKIEPLSQKAPEKKINNKIRIVKDISHLRKLEIKAAKVIQKFFRKILYEKIQKNKLADLVQEMVLPEIREKTEDTQKIKEIGKDGRTSTLMSIEMVKDSLWNSIDFPDLSEEYSENGTKIIFEPDKSDPEILASFRDPPMSHSKKNKPTLFNFLNLSKPDLFISHTINGKIYSFKICIGKVRVFTNKIHYSFQLIGNFEVFTDTLFYSRTVVFDSSLKRDSRFWLPFEFETVWPIVDLELSKHFQFNFIGDLDSSIDQVAIESIKEISYSILAKSDVFSSIIGEKLIPSKKKPTKDIEEKNDFQPNFHIFDKEGIVKSAITFANHDQYVPKTIEELRKNIEISCIDHKIEKGIVHVSDSFLLLNLEIVKKSKNSEYLTSLKLELIAMQSNWHDHLILSWEEFQSFLEIFKYTLSLFFIFSQKKLPSQAREILYTNFSKYFTVSNSKIVQIQPEEEDFADMKNLFENKCQSLIEVHEEWDANEENREDFNDNEEIPNMCLGVIQNVYLNGENDMIHLKVSGVNKNIEIRAKLRLKNQIFTLLIKDYYKIDRFLKIFEMGEVVKSIIKNEICIKKANCGKILTSAKAVKQSSYSAIRKIDCFQYMITITISKNLTIFLYSLVTSREIETTFSKQDLVKYFPNLSLSTSSAINHEKIFFNPLLENFEIFRSNLGNFTGWKLKVQEEIIVSTKKLISAFQFTQIKKLYQQNIITTKPLYERKISAILNEGNSCLTETVYQEEVILQRSKLICGLFCLVTVSKLVLLEEYRIYLHIFQNSREFVCKIYDSDLFGLDENAFETEYLNKNHVSRLCKNETRLWEIMVAEGVFEAHNTLDFVFKFNTILVPMRELLYSNHVKHKTSHYYYETYIKSPIPFNVKFSTIINMKETDYIILTFRSYSLAKKIWVKNTLKLRECILILLNKGFVTEDILLNTFVNYAKIKIFAGVLCRLVKMKNKENGVNVKLINDLEYTDEEEEDIFEEKNSENYSITDMLEQDDLLYAEVHSIKPAVLIEVCFNKVADEFVIKVYKATIGKIFRIPLIKKQVFRVIPFAKTLLKNQVKIFLGKRILEKFERKILLKVNNL